VEYSGQLQTVHPPELLLSVHSYPDCTPLSLPVTPSGEFRFTVPLLVNDLSYSVDLRMPDGTLIKSVLISKYPLTTLSYKRDLGVLQTERSL
jgi:hypothetical protein